MNLLNWLIGKLDAKKERTLVDRFSFHLNRCSDILREADDFCTSEDEYDLYAIAYVVSVFAVAVAGKNREKTSDIILDFLLDELENRYPEKSLIEFRDRIDFYSSVIRGIPLHAHCLPGVDLSDATPITCCAIAFCDCLVNPMYIDDYNDYYPPLFDALEIFHISSEVMLPLNQELAALHNDIYTYAL